jgi:hypothetical protein
LARSSRKSLLFVEFDWNVDEGGFMSRRRLGLIGSVQVAFLTAVVAVHSTAFGGVLPKKAASLVQAAYPGSQVVNVAACELGLAKVSSYGFIVLKKEKALTDEDVLPMIALKSKNTWRLIELEKTVTTERTFIKSFTDEAVERNTFNPNYRIRCVQPKRGEEIGDHLGHYIQEGLSEETLKKSRHLCFQASSVYNNWICFNFDPKLGEVKTSFAQFLAD